VDLLPGKRPLFSVDVVDGNRVWVSLLLEGVCLPKGPLRSIDPAPRAAFLRERRFVEAVSLSRREGITTMLDRSAVRLMDWLPGTVAALYAAEPGRDLCRQVAVKEHVAGRRRRHPSAVTWREGASTAFLEGLGYPIRIQEQGSRIIVEDAPDRR
jgi:hypothetical protein